MTRLDLARALVRPFSGYAAVFSFVVLAISIPVLAYLDKDTTGVVAALGLALTYCGHIYRERRIERTPPTE